MTMLLVGKVLETLGAFLLAYVGGKAAYIEILLIRPITRGDTAVRQVGSPAATDALNDRLSHVAEARRRQFGFIEASLVAAGSFLIALGCAVYLAGLILEHH